MTGQILTFVRTEFSVIVEMTGHFFSLTTRKWIVKDALKCLISLLMIIFLLWSVHVQHHRLIVSLLLDIRT